MRRHTAEATVRLVRLRKPGCALGKPWIPAEMLLPVYLGTVSVSCICANSGRSAGTCNRSRDGRAHHTCNLRLIISHHRFVTLEYSARRANAAPLRRRAHMARLYRAYERIRPLESASEWKYARRWLAVGRNVIGFGDMEDGTSHKVASVSLYNPRLVKQTEEAGDMSRCGGRTES